LVFNTPHVFQQAHKAQNACHNWGLLLPAQLLSDAAAVLQLLQSQT
jgi:hypothetical protein